MARRRVRRNSDAKTRELERAVGAGDAAAAVRLYWHQVRTHGPREHQDSRAYRIELPKIGPVMIRPQGGAISVSSPGPGHDPEPVIVNRVYYRVYGVYFYYPKLGWIPVRPEQIEQVLRGAFGRVRDPGETVSYDPTHRWVNSMDLKRIDTGAGVTQSAFARFMKAFDPAVKRWIKKHPKEIAIGSAIAANNDIWHLQSDVSKLRQKMNEAEAKVGEAIMSELAARNLVSGR